VIKELVFGGQGTSTKLGDAGLLILRVFAGAAMAFAHGLGKVQNPGKAIASADKLGFPVPEVMGWAATLSEFMGGLLLALGLLTRPSAFVLAVTMSVAAFMAHGSDPFQKKELALAYLSMYILLLCTGGGRFSIDALIKK